MPSDQLVWLITGTSSGFGSTFVHSILARGDKVIATARNVDKIKDLEDAGAEVLQLDLNDSKASIHSTVEKAIAVFGHVDVLVNNAAFASVAMAEDLEPEDILAQFNTNLVGTVKVTQALLPRFRSRRTGTTVFMSSLCGWIGHPGNAAYASSKFAIEGFAESLNAETAHLGLKTLLIEPGVFRTNFFSSTNLRTKQSQIADYAEFSRGILGYLASQDQKQPGDPAKLVNVVIDLVRGEGVAKGKEVPFRLPLGSDCVKEVKAKCQKTLEVIDEWEDVCQGTDLVD